MRILPKAVCIGAGLLSSLAIIHGATAQTADSATTTRRGTGTLVRLGTGVTRGLRLGSYGGSSAPLVLGLEHHLTPALSVYGNGFGGLSIGRRPRYADGWRRSLINEYGFDLGVKYYYNQEKRRQKGRATGPFVGNYVSLQSTSDFSSSSHENSHQYSTLTVQWGLQRRLGQYGWLEAYVGAGVRRDPGHSFQTYYGSFQRAPFYSIATELGVKLSLGKVVK